MSLAAARAFADAFYDIVTPLIAAAYGSAVTVIHGDQRTPRPSIPYLVLRVAASASWTGTAGEKWTTDLGQAGEEVEIELSRRLDFSSTMQLILGPHEGDPRAIVVLQNMANRFDLPSVVQSFHAQGISLTRYDEFRQIAEVVDSGRVDRAVLTVRGNGAVNVSERAGYINRILLTGLDMVDESLGGDP